MGFSGGGGNDDADNAAGVSQTFFWNPKEMVYHKRVIDERDIREAIERLLQATPAGSKIVLFGSYARGDAREDSDLDFLVIEPQLMHRRQEMVRLREVLRPMGIPVDILVVSQEGFENWKDWPSNVAYQAHREGKVFIHAA